MSMSQVLRNATDRLSRAGVGSARVDAELLMAFVLGVDRGGLVLAGPPTPGQLARFEILIARRVEREPLQYLLGTAAFRHLLIAVGPGVFVPRPETELLVDAVLPGLRTLAAPLAVDLCSGSGALALAIATEVPSARVIAVERSVEAWPWLERNVGASGAGDRVEIVRADIRDPGLLAELAGLLGRVDLVVCNPPYVPAVTVVGPEVAHDPADAVFAGADGLDLMADVIRVAGALLRPGGRLAVEHDDTQGESVPALLSSAGTDSSSTGSWTAVTDHLDLAGRPRFVTAIRS